MNIKPNTDREIDNLFIWLSSSKDLRKKIDFIGNPNEEKHKKIWKLRKLDSNRKDFACFDYKNIHVGNAGLINLDLIRKKTELYIFIVESPFKGFGSIVLKQLLKVAFEELKLNKVLVNVLKNNLKAIRFFQSNGFIQEGINRSYSLDDNIPIDAIILSMISTEYEAVKTNN